jgi:transposase
MGTKRAKSYTSEFKEQILKECIETNKYSVVARKHNLPVTTVYTWVRTDKNQNNKGQKALKKELEDVKLENKVLKELLKKTHQLWLKD